MLDSNIFIQITQNMSIETENTILPKELSEEIDADLNNWKKGAEKVSKKLAEYIGQVSQETWKSKVQEVTKARIAIAKEHIKRLTPKTEADKADQAKLLEELDSYEQAQKKAEGYLDDVKTRTESKLPEWEKYNTEDNPGWYDLKKNASWEEWNLPLELLKVPLFKWLFLKALDALNSSSLSWAFAWVLWEWYMESIVRSVKSGVAVDSLRDLQKEDKLPAWIKTIDISKMDQLELQPFFWFLDDCKIDIWASSFWNDLFVWKLKTDWKAIIMPKIPTKWINDLDDLYNFLNSIESANPDLMKTQKATSEWFSKKTWTWMETYYYKQYDPRWAHLPYWKKSMAASACWPTSFAMVASMIKWTAITPPEVASWSLRHWHRIDWAWTDWEFMTAAAKNYQIHWRMVWKTDAKWVSACLDKWEYMIASMWPWKFTSGWHYIVLTKWSEPWKVKVLDPGRESRNGEYNISFVLSQAKNFWAYS